MKDDMPRYVILFHETPPGYARPSHYDLMLEAGGALRTWALLAEPNQLAPQSAERLDDHRIAYLDYEGPVSGGRGSVSRWDRGVYDVLEETETRLTVQLDGQKLFGTAMIESGAPGDDELFSFTAD